PVILCSYSATMPMFFSTLSLHDALPIFVLGRVADRRHGRPVGDFEHLGGYADLRTGSIAGTDFIDAHGYRPFELGAFRGDAVFADRKSTRLNSSHDQISYAVFCLKKKNQ